jgi:hypothetical protein
MKHLKAPMTGADCRAEPFSEEHREGLKAACAEDPEIWSIYAWSYDLDHFDETLSRGDFPPFQPAFPALRRV